MEDSISLSANTRRDIMKLAKSDKVNILIVAVSDDNFGDSVIKICFNSLIKVALKNIGVSNFNISNMPMNRIDKKLIANSNIIFFAGGGILKYDYLTFYESIDKITEIADSFGVPIVFSSVGVESFDENNPKCIQLKGALCRECVKAISVRDDLGSLEKYISGTNVEKSVVCDPAVWASYVYDIKRVEKSETIGINVVRAGLFKANGKAWKEKDELQFLSDLIALLEKEKLQYKFFTNGHALDENFLRIFSMANDIPDEHVILQMNNSQKLVEEISKFGAVITFRMHAGIISYALKAPSVALAWNEKLTFFYETLGWQDRCFSFSDWRAETVFDKLLNIFKLEQTIEHDEDYFLSVYKYIFDTLTKYCAYKWGGGYTCGTFWFRTN